MSDTVSVDLLWDICTPSGAGKTGAGEKALIVFTELDVSGKSVAYFEVLSATGRRVKKTRSAEEAVDAYNSLAAHSQPVEE